MKKLLSAVLAFVLVLSLAACGNASGGNIEGSLEDLLKKVTEGTDQDMALMDTPVTKDNFTYYFFTDYIEGSEGLASDAAVNAIPHSVALLRLPDSADAEKVRSDIEAKADPRKWICVEAEKTAVVRHGNLILVAMSTTDIVDKAVTNFDALAK